MPDRPSTRATLATNLRYLLDRNKWSEQDLAARAKVAQKTINNALNQRGDVKVGTCEAIAKPFGLEGWHLILPNLIRDIESGSSITHLVTSYLNSSQEGQRHILGIAEREAKYAAGK